MKSAGQMYSQFPTTKVLEMDVSHLIYGSLSARQELETSLDSRPVLPLYTGNLETAQLHLYSSFRKHPMSSSHNGHAEG